MTTDVSLAGQFDEELEYPNLIMKQGHKFKKSIDLEGKPSESKQLSQRHLFISGNESYYCKFWMQNQKVSGFYQCD